MILQKYQESDLFFNANFFAESSTAGLSAYRGELVLSAGEQGDVKGNKKTPKQLVYGAVLLGDDKLKMVIGWLDKVAELTDFTAKYKADLADDCIVIMYVINAKDSALLEIDGVKITMIPMASGVPWNEALDEAGLEKSDFKGQSSADKVVTLYDEMKSYKPKFPQASLDDVMVVATDRVRENWGAI
ncbi:hypothetical protein [Candidatus Albibeggiatoa sp. nov. BB20]|uniref:hypothetical protein n=1 Tax=Candidatus Albibeggiatoa sp. nov. BB20 TaxID=3162723 RepID=UPI003365805C